MIAINCAYEQSQEQIDEFKGKFGDDFQLFHAPLEPLPENWQQVETAPNLSTLPLVSYQWWRNSVRIETVQLNTTSFTEIVACQNLGDIPSLDKKPDLRTILAPRIYKTPPRTAYTRWWSHRSDHARICLFWKFCCFVDVGHLLNAHVPTPSPEDFAQYTWQFWLINQRMRVEQW